MIKKVMRIVICSVLMTGAIQLDVEAMTKKGQLPQDVYGEDTDLCCACCCWCYAHCPCVRKFCDLSCMVCVGCCKQCEAFVREAAPRHERAAME